MMKMMMKTNFSFEHFKDRGKLTFWRSSPMLIKVG